MNISTSVSVCSTQKSQGHVLLLSGIISPSKIMINLFTLKVNNNCLLL